MRFDSVAPLPLLLLDLFYASSSRKCSKLSVTRTGERDCSTALHDATTLPSLLGGYAGEEAQPSRTERNDYRFHLAGRGAKSCGSGFKCDRFNEFVRDN